MELPLDKVTDRDVAIAKDAFRRAAQACLIFQDAGLRIPSIESLMNASLAEALTRRGIAELIANGTIK